jgi:hypothetical protein
MVSGEATGGALAPPAGSLARPRGPARDLLLLIAIEAVLVMVFLAMPRPAALTLLTLGLGSAALFAAHLAFPEREREPLLVLTALGLLVRVATLALVYYYKVSPTNPSGFLFPDSFGYDQVGEALAEHWRRGIPPRLEYQTAGYTIGFHYFVGWIYRLVGHVPLVVRVLNVLMATTLVPLTFLLGRRLAGARPALVAAGLIAIWPPLVLWSTQLMKDTLIVFLLLVAVLAWTTFAARPRPFSFVLAALPAVPLVFVRTYMFLFWMIGLAVGLASMALGKKKPIVAILLAVLVLGAGVFGAIEYSALRLRSMDVMLGRVNAAGTKHLEGSLFQDVRYRSLIDLLVFFPLGLVRFVLTPLPWKTELIYLHEAMGSVLRYALLPFAVFGFAALWRRQRVMLWPIVVTLILAAGLYAAAFRGGGPRHLTQFYPYFLICAAVGLPRFPNWPLPIGLALGGLLVVGGALTLR